MKAFAIALSLTLLLLVSPVFGQQPTDKPEMPPPDRAVYVEVPGTIMIGRLLTMDGASSDAMRLCIPICISNANGIEP